MLATCSLSRRGEQARCVQSQSDKLPHARRVPLPALYMRFVLQTLQASPRLKNFVLDILSSLAGKQVGCCPAFASRLLVWPCVLAATS